MSLIKRILFKTSVLIIVLISYAQSEELKKLGSFKDWEAIMVSNDSGKVCFAQSKPVLQSPKNNPREARLFVAFRPNEKIIDEISITSGYEYNNKNSVIAKSGKNKYKFEKRFTNIYRKSSTSYNNHHYRLSYSLIFFEQFQRFE